MDRSDRNSSLSLRRGIALVQAVGERATPARGATSAELARTIGVHVSTASRLAAPLAELGLLRRDSNGRYHLGKGVLDLGRAYLAGLDLTGIASAILQGYAWPGGSSCVVVAPSDTEAVVLEEVTRRAGGYTGWSDDSRRRRAPMYCTAAGKAMLAFGNPQLIDRTIKTGLPAVTERTITDPSELRSELGRIRVRGYAIEDRELSRNIRAVSAAIFDYEGHVAGAVEVAALASEMQAPVLRTTAREVIAAAREISLAMGSPARSELTRKA